MTLQTFGESCTRKRANAVIARSRSRVQIFWRERARERFVRRRTTYGHCFLFKETMQFNAQYGSRGYGPTTDISTSLSEHDVHHQPGQAACVRRQLSVHIQHSLRFHIRMEPETIPLLL